MTLNTSGNHDQQKYLGIVTTRMRPISSTVVKARGLLNSDLSTGVVRNTKF